MFKQEVLNTKTAIAQSTTLAMDASLVTIPHLYQFIGETIAPGESQVDKDWRYVGNSERETLRQSFNFYQYHSRTIQQAGGKIKKEKLEYIYIIGML